MSSYKKSKSGLWLRDKLVDQRGFLPGIMPVVGPQGPPPLPQSGLTLHFDFSDISTLFKTYTPTNDPAYSDVATADGDVIRVARSIVPAATSDFIFEDQTDSTKAPILRSSTPLLGTQCLDFDGSNDRLELADRSGTSGIAADTVLTASAGTIMAAFRCESLPVGGGTFQPIVATNDASFRYGLYIFNDAGTVKLLAQNFDGSYDSALGDTISVDTNYVGMWRHEGGNIISVLNDGTETSTASGNTSGLNLAGVRVGGGGDGSVLNGRVGEVAIWNVALSGADLALAWSTFLAKWT